MVALCHTFFLSYFLFFVLFFFLRVPLLVQSIFYPGPALRGQGDAKRSAETLVSR